MIGRRPAIRLVALALLLAVPPAIAKVPLGNHFADVYIDGDRAGAIHFTSRKDEDGRVQELRTRLSLSALGFEVFEYQQRLVEEWEDGQFVFLSGRTNDDGDLFELTLRRSRDALRGRVNGRPVKLPAHAFPASPWHYEIVEQDLLFGLKKLELREVDIEASSETLTLEGEAIETERFDISGDWDATIWYDQERRLARFRYQADGHEILVVPER